MALALGIALAPAALAERATVVKRPGVEKDLAAQNAAILEDYGSFLLVDRPDAPAAATTPAAATALEARRRTAGTPVGAIRLAEMAVGPGTAPSTRLDPRLVIDDYPEGSAGLYLVRFYGPPRLAWLARVEELGAQVVEYVPENTYVVRMTPEQRRRLASGAVRGSTGRDAVEWTSVWQPAYRLSSRLARRSGLVAASFLVLDDPAGRAVVERLRKQGFVLREPSAQPPYLELVVSLSSELLFGLAHEPPVYRIDEWTPPVPHDEASALNVAGQRCNGTVAGFGLAGVPYMTWLQQRGFDTSRTWDFVVNVSDTGFDKGQRAGTWHTDLYGVTGDDRVAYVKDWTADAGTDRDGVDGNGHGTTCAGVVGGYSAAGGTGNAAVSTAGYHFGMGVAPMVRLGGSKIFDFNGAWGLTTSYAALEAHAFANGARLSSNSWGANTNSYTSDARAYDILVRDASAAAGNQPLIVLFAAGNAGPGAGTVGSPGTAKNVITLAAAEAWWPGYTACGWSSAFQNTPGDDIVYYSSRGPAHDGRIKPDVAAIANGWVTTRGAYAGTGCGNPYDTADPAKYRNFNGTSAATPAAAGAAALLYQYGIDHWGGPPSPALVKAALVASARDLVGGVDAKLTNGTGVVQAAAPNASQGWGLVDTGRLFDGAPALRVDQSRLFTATGEAYSVNAQRVSAQAPLRVVLAWTDAPGNVGAAALKNDLDLEVEAGGVVYYGNVFAGGVSATGGSADRVNNVEGVVLPAGGASSLRITVRAAAIVADGVPGNASPLDQDFAVYAYNATDCVPPAPPVTAAAAADGANRVTVSWVPAAAGTSFAVYRATQAGGPYAPVGTAPAGATSFVDAGVSGGTRYHYVVRAVAGCESASSQEASALATGRCTLPPAFDGLASATNAGLATCGVQLAWPAATARCGGPLSYDVFRSTSANFVPGPTNRLARGVAGTAYTDAAGLAQGTSYTYVVRATDAASGVSDANAVRRTTKPSGATGATTRYAWSGSSTTIPDNAPGISAAIDVPASGSVADVKLNLSITHPYKGDLLVRLTSPASIVTTVHNLSGGSGDNIQTSYDVPTLPDGPGTMDSFDNAAGGGRWTLYVQDTASADIGSLSAASIDLTLAASCAAGAAPPPTEASPEGESRLARGAGTTLVLTYTPAGWASNTTVYTATATAGGVRPAWARAFCAVGSSGVATFDPGALAAGRALWILPVGNDGAREGSYGEGSSGVERPEANGLECDFTRVARLDAGWPDRPRPATASWRTAGGPPGGDGPMAEDVPGAEPQDGPEDARTPLPPGGGVPAGFAWLPPRPCGRPAADEDPCP